jgi:hypothetical protein
MQHGETRRGSSNFEPHLRAWWVRPGKLASEKCFSDTGLQVQPELSLYTSSGPKSCKKAAERPAGQLKRYNVSIRLPHAGATTRGSLFLRLAQNSKPQELPRSALQEPWEERGPSAKPFFPCPDGLSSFPRPLCMRPDTLRSNPMGRCWQPADQAPRRRCRIQCDGSGPRTASARVARIWRHSAEKVIRQSLQLQVSLHVLFLHRFGDYRNSALDGPGQANLHPD